MSTQPAIIQSIRYGTFMLSMLGDLVLVQRMRRETTNSGLWIVRGLQNMQYGVVVGVGPRCRALRPEQEVCFLERTGQPMFHADDRFEQSVQERDLLVMHECHVLGVIEDWE